MAASRRLSPYPLTRLLGNEVAAYSPAMSSGQGLSREGRGESGMAALRAAFYLLGGRCRT